MEILKSERRQTAGKRPSPKGNVPGEIAWRDQKAGLAGSQENARRPKPPGAVVGSGIVLFDQLIVPSQIVSKVREPLVTSPVAAPGTSMPFDVARKSSSVSPTTMVPVSTATLLMQ